MSLVDKCRSRLATAEHKEKQTRIQINRTHRGWSTEEKIDRMLERIETRGTYIKV